MPPLRRFGPYEVVRPLGSGGMGTVFEVRHPDLDRPLALKALAPGRLDPRRVERFRREGEALARVRHPGVVAVHQAADSPQGPYLVTDLVPGQDLEEELEAGGPFAPRRAAEVVRDLCDAVAAVHAEGLLHRDLKPANVILTPAGRPVLVDFGLARLEGSDGLTLPGAVLGTPGYMAPEQARGLPADARTDVWGLGAVLHRLLGGEPGAAAPPAGLDPGLAAVCQRALSQEPEGRYPSARALQEDLERWLAGLPPLARPARAGRVGLLLAGGVLVALGGAGLAALRGKAAEPRAGADPVPAASASDAGAVALEQGGQEALAAALSHRDPPARREALRAWLAAHPGHPGATEALAGLRRACWEVPAWTLEPAQSDPAGTGRGLWLDDAAVLLVVAGPDALRLERWAIPTAPHEEPRRLERWTAPAGTLVGVARLERGPGLVLAGPGPDATRPGRLEVRELREGLPGRTLRSADLPGVPLALVTRREVSRAAVVVERSKGLNDLRWCDLLHPELQGEVLLPGRGFFCAAWSPTGELLGVVTHDLRPSPWQLAVEVWQVDPRRQLLLQQQESHGMDLAFLPGEPPSVAVAGRAGDVLVHRVGEQEPVPLVAADERAATSVQRLSHLLQPAALAALPDGRLVSAAAEAARGEVRRWDVGQARELPPALTGLRAVRALEASPDGRRLLVSVPGGVEVRWLPEGPP